MQHQQQSEGKKYQKGGSLSDYPEAELDFIVRPRFGNKFVMISPGSSGAADQQRESVLLSSVLNRLDNPATQPDALAQLGIRLLSKSRVQLDLQEYPPGKQMQNGNSQTAAARQEPTNQLQSMELRATYATRNPVLQPLGIKVSYLRDAYIEAETAYCCLLEVSSPYGDAYSVPVLGRGSFSYLGDADSKSPNPTLAQREHCIGGASAGFLQRAAVSLACLLCLCELAPQDEAAVLDFYRRVDKAFGYGYRPYLDYLAYCCQTESRVRDSYLKHLCLEFNNRFTQNLMTQALTHFVETRQPTPRYYEQVASTMTADELAKDRQVHYSMKGRAAKASMYLKNASRQHMGGCCPCHVM